MAPYKDGDIEKSEHRTEDTASCRWEGTATSKGKQPVGERKAPRKRYIGDSAKRRLQMKCSPKFMILIALIAFVAFAFSSEAASKEQEKKACRDSLGSFRIAQEMMSDEQGNIVQLSDRQEKEMKDLIRKGLKSSRSVSDKFLDDIHPKMKSHYRNDLIRGWSLYLQGLETESLQKQISGIRLVQKWESYFIKNYDLLVDELSPERRFLDRLPSVLGGHK